MQPKTLFAPLAGLIALALAGAAAAQPAANWNGPYVGVLAGAQLGDAGFSLPGDTSDVLQSTRDRKTGFEYGGVAGYNLTLSGIVLGLEADLVEANKVRSVVACNVADGCFTSAHDSFTTDNDLKQTLNGHLRVRAGVASGGNLFYLAGGYAVARTELDLIGDCYNAADPSVPTIYTYDHARTVSGYTLGAGVEHAVSSHLMVRAEYLYDGYGRQTYAGEAPEWNTRSIDLHNSNLRMGVSYRF